MESLGTFFVAAAWGVPLVSLLGGVVVVVAITRWRRRTISALEWDEEEQGGPAFPSVGKRECSGDRRRGHQ